ncbi:MAG: xanthine dehydrogenase family protein molybdopterin-binding subunit [Hyphomicrobium sp.]|nr:xanthine dehydrogenase family protein molybdopterin-binding subunit [Hyphomicrobium sp.]
MLRQIESFANRSPSFTDDDRKTVVLRKVGSAELNRRSVLQGLGVFVIAAQFMPTSAEAFETYPTNGLKMPNGVVNDPHIFVAIAPDGEVTIVAHRAEMGTGIRTTLPMIIADEMEADWGRVKIVQAPGDEPKYGNQDTDGSRSLRHFIQPAREIGAATRHMLEQAAAKRWGVDIDTVKALDHQVVHRKLGNRLGFGDLAHAAMSLETPARSALSFKTEQEFRYIGRGQVQIYDLHDITTGAAIYGADVNFPDTKVAVIARPPVVGAKIKSINDKKARAVPGVEKILRIPITPLGSKFKPLGGVAVVAQNTWAAMKGRDALQIEWDRGKYGTYSTKTHEKELRLVASKPGSSVRKQGDPDGALKKAATVLSYEYYQPHAAQAPMEPPTALARFKDGKIEIWAPVQSPYVARTDTAEYLGMKPEDVTVNVTLLGGAFGRKSKADFATEAAFLAKEIGGSVRVQWTRDDDIRHSYYHTTSVERIDVGLDENNKPIAWRQRSAAPSFKSTFGEDKGVQHDIEIGMGLENLPYEIANIGAEQCPAFSGTRVGWFRSVSNIQRAFSVQSATAELAVELGKDQKDFLLELIGPARILNAKACGLPGEFWNQYEPYKEFPFDTGRLSNVVKLAAERAGWGKTLPKGEGLGIAAHRSFVSYVATVIHAKVEDGTVKLPSVHVVIDCGFAANPERIRSQIEGACAFAMTTALYSGITFKDGEVQESNFHDYEMVRSDNFPFKVNTHIVPHPFSVHATGVGEPAVPPFAPALMNAIFNASGKRIRNLPIKGQLRS